MQNAFVKKRIGAAIGTLTFLVLIALFVCLPNTSYGELLAVKSQIFIAPIPTLTENNMTVINCLPVLTM